MRWARQPSSTSLQRRSRGEFRRVIQSSFSKRCNNVTTVGSSTPSRAAISVYVSASGARDRCKRVRHFAWLKPIGLRRSSSFCRQARAVPCSNGPIVSQSDMVQAKLVSMLTNSDLPDCQSLWLDLEKSHPALAIIRDASESMRPPRRPLLRSGCFVLAFRLHKKIMCIPRQVRHLGRVDQWCFHVKQHRLIIRIHRVERLARRYQGINFRRRLFYLLSVSQNERSKRIPNSTDHESKSDKGCHHPSPHSFAPQLHSLRPLPCIADITHGKQAW